MLSVFHLDLAFLTSLQMENNPSEKTGNTSRSNPREHAQDGPENLKTTNDGTISALDLTGRTLRIPDSIHQKRIDENGDEFACQHDQCSHLKAFLDLPGAQSQKENSAKSDERGGATTPMPYKTNGRPGSSFNTKKVMSAVIVTSKRLSNQNSQRGRKDEGCRLVVIEENAPLLGVVLEMFVIDHPIPIYKRAWGL